MHGLTLEPESSYPHVDKINILQSVSIFSTTPRAILADVADKLEEVNALSGATIFEKGDLGTSM